MQSDRAERAWRAKIMRELEAVHHAVDKGKKNDVIYYLRRAEARCLQDDLTEPTPPPSGVLLTIDEVCKKTGYSKGRLRHMGHTLAGYWKSPTGKVGWWSGLLEAALALNEAMPK